MGLFNGGCGTLETILAAARNLPPYVMLLVIAIAPTMVLLSYLYVRDKYEKEPLGLIAKAFFLGCLSVVPVMMIEISTSRMNPFLGFWNTVYESFLVAALTEELFKLGAVYLAVYHSPHFNEPYDGVIYAASASLGFATIENIGYVFQHGLTTGLNRAILAVPGHALWGIAMGYYLGKAKFSAPKKRSGFWLLAFVVPFVFHGLYDLIAYNMNTVFSILMYPLVAFLWVTALRQIDKAEAASPFRFLRPVRRSTSVAMSQPAGLERPMVPADMLEFGLDDADDVFDDESDVDEQDLGFELEEFVTSGNGQMESACPACNQAIKAGVIACPHCGAPLISCVYCQTPAPAASKFCSKCGAALSGR